MRASRSPGEVEGAGFTLIEVIVVLVVMGIAVGLVAPAFFPPRRDDGLPLGALIRRTQDIAASRGETIYLSIASSGDWRLDGGSTVSERALATGTLDGFDGPHAVLVVSPLGTCGFDVRSSEAARVIPLDPLTCELVTP